MLRFHPTVATTCFGMNDGGYSPMSPDKAKHYREAQTAIVAGVKKAGVRVIVVGSPGCVDADAFRNDPNAAIMYNKTLTEERDIAREVAQSEGVLFADVITPMIDAMTKAKAKYGKDYHLAGGDGVHPDQERPTGHGLCLSQGARLRRRPGQNHGRSGGRQGRSGRRAQGCRRIDKGTVEMESTRYPFCFYGDPAKPNATRGVIEFFPVQRRFEPADARGRRRASRAAPK